MRPWNGGGGGRGEWGEDREKDSEKNSQKTS